MGTIHQKFTGDARQLEQEYQKLLQQQVKMEEKLRRVGDASKKCSEEQKSAANSISRYSLSALQSIDGMIKGYASVQNAIQFINGELETKRELERKSLEMVMPVADAKARVSWSLGDIKREDREAFFTDLAGIRKETGFESEVPILIASEKILQANGRNREATKEVLAAIAPIMKSDHENMGEVGAVIGKMSKASGMSPDEIIGRTVGAMEAAGITSVDTFEVAIPAIAKAVSTIKADPKRGIADVTALFAGIAKEVPDPQAAVKELETITKGLETAFPGNFSLGQRVDKFQDLNSQIQKMEREGKDSSAMAETIVALKQTRPELAEMLLQDIKPIAHDKDLVPRLLDRVNKGSSEQRMADRDREFQGEKEATVGFETKRFRAEQMGKFHQAMDSVSHGFGQTAFKSSAFASAEIDQSSENLTRMLKIAEKNILERGSWLGIRRTEDKLNTEERQDIAFLRSAIKTIQESAREEREMYERMRRTGSAAVQARLHLESN
jgi:hypothetical protein